MTGESFRESLRSWATGVAVLTLHDGEGPRGITINSFTSVSLEPPLVLVCIGKRARIHDALVRATRFCVNVLAADQRDIADRFAGRTAAAGGSVRYGEAPYGVPCLPRGLARFDCAPVAAHDAGDHTIVVARVDHVEAAGRGEPLLFFGGRYEELARERSPNGACAGVDPVQPRVRRATSVATCCPLRAGRRNPGFGARRTS